MKPLVKDLDLDDECVILNGDLDKPVDIKNDGINESDDLLVVGEKGQVSINENYFFRLFFKNICGAKYLSTITYYHPFLYAIIRVYNIISMLQLSPTVALYMLQIVLVYLIQIIFSRIWKSKWTNFKYEYYVRG